MICIINGPNLNLLGKRQPEIYGSRSFESFLEELRREFHDTEIEYFQSNHEGEIIDKLHKLGYETPECSGIVMNPGAFAHYSYAIADAVASINPPVVEVHISNIHARDEFRHKSVTAPYCKGMLTGFGLQGYRLAIISLNQTTSDSNGNS
ncbi:MAG: type II 3-dehydroquinate dehydratase [Muribaculaceae bacterium]|nr:type II 3-dehydroquinate dehydratase [Muribaculaceae bacterium]